MLILTTLLGAGSPVCAKQPTPASSNNLITMNFENVDIPVLAEFISRVTGKNFLLDDSVRGKITIIAPAKVTPMQAYCIFESALQMKGFATVSAGPVIKIMPSRDARAWAALTRSREPAAQCSQAATQR